MKVKKLHERYWVDNDDIMSQVTELQDQLELEGFTHYSDKYSGSMYYCLYSKRETSGNVVCKAVQYNDTQAQIIDVTIDHLNGRKPLDDFEGFRRDMTRLLMPKRESVENTEKDEFVLYYPNLKPRVINKEQAIKKLEDLLKSIREKSGPKIAGKGLGLYCLKSVDKEDGTVYEGEYSIKEFLSAIS